jgi:hypothetical protein
VQIFGAKRLRIQGLDGWQISVSTFVDSAQYFLTCLFNSVCIVFDMHA